MTEEARNATTVDPEPRGGLEPRADGRYRVEELFAFHDRAFVENAFRAALGREPGAAELESTLSDLRASRRGKREIVEDLVFCEEGERGGARARIEGVRDPRLRRRVRGLPVVGYLWQLLAGIARLPRLMRHQREFEAYAHAQQQVLAERLDDQERRAQSFISEQVRLALERLDADVLASIADAREAVFMLSDALASLSARHEREIKQRERSEAQLAASLDAHQRGIVELQHALEAARHEIEGQARGLDEQQRRLDAQEEFLIQEQRAIVEAQKAALAEIEERLREAEASARRALDAPAAETRATADATLPPRAAREA